MNAAPSHTDVLIVGGGSASLYLAHQIAVQAPNLTVTVLERAHMRDRSRRGVLVHPLSQELLEPAIDEADWTWNGQIHQLREFHGPTLHSELDASATTAHGQIRYPCNTSLDDLSDALRTSLAAVSNVEIHYESQLDFADRTRDGWTVQVNALGEAQSITCAVLVAADGRASRLRDSLGIPYEEVQFPGRVDILAVRERRDAAPAVSMVVGDDGATTVVDNGMGPNTLIFDMRPDGADPKAPTSVRERVRERSAVAGLTLPVDVEPLFTTSIRSATIACGAWVAGSAMVFGDAAHAMHNVGGQGFNLAVQNATAIAPHIEALVAGDSAQLRAFEAYRLPYVSELQRRQNELFDLLAQGRHDSLGEGWFRPIHRTLTLGQSGFDDFLPYDGAVRSHA